MKKFITIFFSVIVVSYSFSQDEKNPSFQIDSLQKIISSQSHDSLKVKALREWDNLIYMYDAELDLQLNQKIDSICKINLKKNNSKKAYRFFTLCKAEANNAFGIICQQTGKLQEAITHYEVYLKLCREINDQNGIAAAYSNIGIVKQMLGHYDIATKYYLKSLKIREKNGNKKGMAICYGNIAMAYKYKDELKTALNYNMKSYSLIKQLDDPYSLALITNNIGTLIQDLADSASIAGNKKLASEKYKDALLYYEKSLKICQDINDLYGESTALHNIGNIYSDINQISKAKKYYSKAIQIREEIEDQIGVSSSLNNLAIIFLDEGNYQMALEYSRKAFDLAKESESMEEVSYSAKSIYKSYKYLENYKEALQYFEYHIQLRDSLKDEANQKSVMQIQYKYDYEKQAIKDSIRNAELQKVKDAEIKAQKEQTARQELELKNKRTQQKYMIVGITFLVIFLGFVYNRFKVSQRQKKIIEIQKTEVENQKSVVVEAHHQLEEKNKEILDSINYAKRIQAAILPPRKLVKEYLPESFILYKPKDIVAGDFYWLEHKNNSILFAACDCTGHGVPGAMVSVVCNNGLNRAVREHGLTDPGEILDKTREIVISEFEKSEEEVKDGMDVSLVNLEILNNEIVKLKWAGANNPLWLITNGEIKEYKANKQPIGKYTDPLPFTTHEIEIKKGDSIYIFTDGFQDQFGGEKGKKFKAAKFKELLLSIQNKSIDEQKVAIDEQFEKWRGELEQNDDVCVIGVRL